MFFNKRAKPNNSANSNERYLIVGLGNPGSKYDCTKHNVGFDAVDLLARKHNIKISKIKFKSLYGEGKINGKSVVLIKPQTYMNLSGESLSSARSWYKVPEERIIVVFDDIDIPTGNIRIRRSGSAGSHNGMKSIIYKLGRDNFPRVKIGIGPKPESWNLADYVLSKFSADEHAVISKSIESAALAIEEILESDIETAMRKHN